MSKTNLAGNSTTRQPVVSTTIPSVAPHNCSSTVAVANVSSSKETLLSEPFCTLVSSKPVIWLQERHVSVSLCSDSAACELCLHVAGGLGELDAADGVDLGAGEGGGRAAAGAGGPGVRGRRLLHEERELLGHGVVGVQTLVGAAGAVPDAVVARGLAAAGGARDEEDEDEAADAPPSRTHAARTRMRTEESGMRRSEPQTRTSTVAWRSWASSVDDSAVIAATADGAAQLPELSLEEPSSIGMRDLVSRPCFKAEKAAAPSAEHKGRAPHLNTPNGGNVDRSDVSTRLDGRPRRNAALGKTYEEEEEPEEWKLPSLQNILRFFGEDEQAITNIIKQLGTHSVREDLDSWKPFGENSPMKAGVYKSYEKILVKVAESVCGRKAAEASVAAFSQRRAPRETCAPTAPDASTTFRLLASALVPTAKNSVERRTIRALLCGLFKRSEINRMKEDVPGCIFGSNAFGKGREDLEKLLRDGQINVRVCLDEALITIDFHLKVDRGNADQHNESSGLRWHGAMIQFWTVDPDAVDPSDKCLEQKLYYNYISDESNIQGKHAVAALIEATEVEGGKALLKDQFARAAIKVKAWVRQDHSCTTPGQLVAALISDGGMPDRTAAVVQYDPDSLQRLINQVESMVRSFAAVSAKLNDIAYGYDPSTANHNSETSSITFELRNCSNIWVRAFNYSEVGLGKLLLLNTTAKKCILQADEDENTVEQIEVAEEEEEDDPEFSLEHVDSNDCEGDGTGSGDAELRLSSEIVLPRCAIGHVTGVRVICEAQIRRRACKLPCSHDGVADLPASWEPKRTNDKDVAAYAKHRLLVLKRGSFRDLIDRGKLLQDMTSLKYRFYDQQAHTEPHLQQGWARRPAKEVLYGVKYFPKYAHEVKSLLRRGGADRHDKLRPSRIVERKRGAPTDEGFKPRKHHRMEQEHADFLQELVALNPHIGRKEAMPLFRRRFPEAIELYSDVRLKSKVSILKGMLSKTTTDQSLL
ncbi:unnamed protein product [Phytophthora lilii]|uniref:Unnamed protein product n=1 Tax=Phytophthora lilii TaxID=2077276 RepID=A0A9W6WP16_9STRA|nr:unnamed protein product [Phytophthora lilii]